MSILDLWLTFIQSFIDSPIMTMNRFLLFLALLVISSASSFTLPTAGPNLNVRKRSGSSNEKKRFLTCVTTTASSSTKPLSVSTKPIHLLLNKKNTVSWILAFTAGLMNIVCSLRFGCSVLMMTGNYVALGRSLAKHAWIDVSFLLCLVINYCTGFSLSRAIETST